MATLRDKLRELEGKKIWADLCGDGYFIRKPPRESTAIFPAIEDVEEDHIVLDDGYIISISAIRSIEPNI